MAGRGRTPKAQSRTRHKPIRGPWRTTEGVGWQHGEIPEPPDDLLEVSHEVWRAWFSGWFAAFWGPEDVPGLPQCIRLYNEVERGEFQRSPELRLTMDTYGITAKGQQDRRWVRPEPSEEPKARPTKRRYAHLKVVSP